MPAHARVIGIGLAAVSSLLMMVSPAQAVVKHGWQIGEKLPTGNPGVQVNAMAATGPNDIWALGGQTAVRNHALTGIPFAQHFNGKKWTAIALPAGHVGYFYAATAVSKNDVWALGETNNAMQGAFTAHYNGKRWTYLKTAQATFGNQLTAVASKDVWVAQSTGQNYEYLLRWTGASWHRYKVPGTAMNAVGGVATNDVWAAGQDSGGFPEMLHWNGKTWSVVPTPKVGSGQAPLYGIVALSKNNVYAVGYVWSTQQTTALPLAMHWNGHTWGTVSVSGLTQTGELTTPVADGHGGFWAQQPAPSNMAGQTPGFVPLVHYSNGHWSTAALPVVPGVLQSVNDLISVPGTGNLWAPVSYQTTTGGNWDGLLLDYTP